MEYKWNNIGWSTYIKETIVLILVLMEYKWNDDYGSNKGNQWRLNPCFNGIQMERLVSVINLI